MSYARTQKTITIAFCLGISLADIGSSMGERFRLYHSGPVDRERLEQKKTKKNKNNCVYCIYIFFCIVFDMCKNNVFFLKKKLYTEKIDL